MLDIKFIKENPKRVQEAAAAKGVTIDINAILKIINEFKDAQQKIQKLNEQRNIAAKERNIEKGKELKEQLEKESEVNAELEKKVNVLLSQIPNPAKPDVKAGKDESESSKALRRLYVSLILSVVFDASVAIRRAADIGELVQSAGAAYVPPVPAVRSLIGREWVKASEARYWLTAIGAASILARDASLPPRSALYQALASDPAERLVRRIEAGGRSISPLQLSLISQLPGFHAGRLQEVHP